MNSLRNDSRISSPVPTEILNSQASNSSFSKIATLAQKSLDENILNSASLKRTFSASNLSSSSISAKCPKGNSPEDLRAHGSDEEISAYLNLGNWRGGKNTDAICLALIQCFRNQNERLLLSDLGAISLPNCLEQMTQLTILSLHILSKVRNLSVISKLKNLKALQVIGNVEDLSFLKHMSHLTGLTIAGNESLLDLSILKHLPNLKYLRLNKNPNLKSLSGIEPLIKLKMINLDNSNIRSISPLKDLPTLTDLSAYGTTLGLTPTDPNRNQIAFLGGKSPLGLLRAEISDESLQRVDLCTFIKSHKELSSWVARLANQDRDPGMRIQAWESPLLRSTLSAHTLEILQLAQQDKVFFKEILLPLVDASMTDCADRTIYYFNEIIRSKALYQTKTLSDSEALLLFKKYYPLALAKDLARESAEKRNILREEIEVQIDFFQNLDIDLPFLNTQFVHIYKASGEEIKRVKIEFSKRLTALNYRVGYLCLDRFWQERLILKNPAFKPALLALEDAKYEDLERILASSPNDTAALRALETAHKERVIRLFSTASF